MPDTRIIDYGNSERERYVESFAFTDIYLVGLGLISVQTPDILQNTEYSALEISRLSGIRIVSIYAVSGQTGYPDNP